jgi:5-methylcytosine-specific restriction endonuclease McrA
MIDLPGFSPRPEEEEPEDVRPRCPCCDVLVEIGCGCKQCQDCLSTPGWYVGAFERKLCPTCDGSGWL